MTASIRVFERAREYQGDVQEFARRELNLDPAAIDPSMVPEPTHEETSREVFVVSLDLCQSSMLSSNVEHLLGAEAMLRFGDQISSEIQTVLEKQLPRDRFESRRQFIDESMCNTGDGAILFFANVEDAVGFAVEFQRVDRSISYRIGISSGTVAFRRWKIGDRVTKVDSAGTAIAEAVRLESQCEPGSILVANNALAEIENLDVGSLFGRLRKYSGKAHEADISARSWRGISKSVIQGNLQRSHS